MNRYTIVWIEQGAVYSCGYTIGAADDAKTARDGFERFYPARTVVGVFLGAQHELLSTHENETHYLGQVGR
jgi:hypothetical protein